MKTGEKETLRKQVANRIGNVRTHVDVTNPRLIALEVLLKVKEEVNLQIVAFQQEGIMSYPNGKVLMENAVKMGVNLMGSIPSFEFTREYGVESIYYIMDLVKKYDKLVDVHCDEIDDEQSWFVETLNTRAYEAGMGKKV